MVPRVEWCRIVIGFDMVTIQLCREKPTKQVEGNLDVS